MSVPGFTPGPWSTYPDDPLVINSDGASLGKAVPGDPTVSRREALANARLWAAAPDLFGALKDLRTRFYKALIYSRTDAEFASIACEAADAALSKATGQQAPFTPTEESA